MYQFRFGPHLHQLRQRLYAFKRQVCCKRRHLQRRVLSEKRRLYGLRIGHVFQRRYGYLLFQLQYYLCRRQQHYMHQLYDNGYLLWV